MEAIADLLAALIEGCVGLFLATIQLVSALLFAVFEFVFVWLTQGPVAARHRREKRSRTRTARKDSAKSTSTSTGLGGVSKSVYAAMAVLILGTVVWGASDYCIRQSRIKTTQALVGKWSKKFATDPPENQSVSEKIELPIRDAWNEPLQLFVEEALVGRLIAVRSRGPDRRSGTLDDILSVEVEVKDLRQMGQYIGKGVMKQVRQKIPNLD